MKKKKKTENSRVYLRAITLLHTTKKVMLVQGKGKMEDQTEKLTHKKEMPICTTNGNECRTISQRQTLTRYVSI